MEAVRQATKAPVAMHPIAYEYTAYQSEMAMMWLGRPLPRMNEPEMWLEEGQEISVGKLKFQVLLCPGHTPATSASTARECCSAATFSSS